jgi:hypothetical protein
MPIKRSLGLASVALGLAIGFCVMTINAQQAANAAQKPGTGALNLTATSANVTQPGNAVRINILRWSTDEERNALAVAMNPPPPPPAAAGGGDRGGGRGAAGAGAAAGAAGAAGARGGRGGGGGGRGGRGDAPAAPADPIVNLTAAIGKAPTVGYIWTNEVVGYSIKYAYRLPLPNGGDRIILATDRRLGAHTAAWKPTATAASPEYEFTLLEVRLDPKGVGEAKTSLTTKVVVDDASKTIALENYAATPTILQNVKK